MHKRYRLTKRNDFQNVYRLKQSAANLHYVVFYRKNSQTEHFRLGVSVSKKMGNAVLRNRLRRVIKEIVRLNKERIVRNADIIVITRKGVEHLDYAQMEKSLLHALKRAKLLEPRPGNDSRNGSRISKLK